jgi:hypothetical protein
MTNGVKEIPVCAVTGRIAGDTDACGDCDPCGAAHTVPDVVKRLLAEKEEWRQKYSDAASEVDMLQAAIAFVRGRSARAGEILNEFDATQRAAT